MTEQRERVYTTFQIADICRVRPTTVIKWANQSRIKVYTTPGGHRRVREADLLDFLKQYNFPIPAELGGSRRKILVVEDEIDLGHLIVKAFQRASSDVDVLWSKDGVEALLEVGKNTPDLVVLDVAMPLVDGSRVLATLRSDPKTQKVRVIGMTGQRLPPDKLSFMKKNTHAFFLKPFKIQDMVARSLNLLGLGPVPQRVSVAGKK